jgi:hypothetical protein
VLIKRYSVPALAFGILGGYLLGKSDYVWAGLAFGVCVLLAVVAVLVGKGERVD